MFSLSDKLKIKKMNHLVAEILSKVRYDPPPPLRIHRFPTSSKYCEI